MKRSTKLVMAGTAGVAAILGGLLLPRIFEDAPMKPSVSAKLGISEASQGGKQNRPPRRIAIRAALHQAADESAARKPAIEPAAEEADYEAPSVVHTVAKSDPALYEIAYYRHHVLLDAVGQGEYHELLSDQWMLDKVRNDILNPEETKENIVGNTKRLMEIDFLRDALAWDENPKRNDILDMIEEMILTDNFREGINTGMRLSLAGNKMELFELLKNYDAARAQSLVEQARGGRMEGLLAFISDEIAGRQEREASNAIVP